jgi:hypothetical protein
MKAVISLSICPTASALTWREAIRCSGILYQWMLYVLRIRIHFRLRPDDFCETPRADPHPGCCGEGRLITVPYPIMRIFHKSHPIAHKPIVGSGLLLQGEQRIPRIYGHPFHTTIYLSLLSSIPLNHARLSI